MTGAPALLLPTLDEASAPFWQSGSDGCLRILRCRGCGLYLHPPAPVCRVCQSTAADWTPVSGLGTVESLTIPAALPASGPLGSRIIAIVALDEQPGLWLTTCLIGSAPEQVSIGMRVRVVFQHVEDVYLPLFQAVT